MKKSKKNIVVLSPSFAKNNELRARLEEIFFNVSYLNLADQEKQSIQQALATAHGIIVGLEKLDSKFLSHCSQLEIISKYGVGIDNIDLEYCHAHRIEVGWIGGVNKLAVAEQTLALMISLMRNLFTSSQLLKNGEWKKNGGQQLSAKTVGLIGLGHVGREVVRLLHPFNCRILFYDVVAMKDITSMKNVTQVELDFLLAESDIVSLHVPLSSTTEKLFNEKTFEKMKEGSYLINTARGAIVDAKALKEALLSKKIAGAAIDVYEEEPPQDLQLLAIPELICTPHIAGNSKEAVELMGRTAISHLEKFYGEI